MPYNHGTHHRRSIRLKNYDYSQNGAYFVTLCAWQRECLFGEIPIAVGAGSKPAQDAKPARNAMTIDLNDFGKLVDFTWHDLQQHITGITLDDFVIMPNHVHFIVVIDNCANSGDPGLARAGLARAGLEPAPTLSEIVRQFKTFSAKRINALRNNPGCPVWQRNYYERVIRNDDELSLVREYIVNNPMKWELDRENPVHHKLK